jgi:UDP-N-acetylglucosamine 3-dehydrogenase
MQRESADKKVRIGLLGVAHIHAESYASVLSGPISNAELVAVYDRNESAGRQFARRHKTVYVKSIQELLSKVDAVLIASENTFHHQLAKSAAKAGKHILCEKPIAITLQDAELIKQDVRKAKVKFQMCYVMRYHTVASVVKELIDEGRIGEILALVGTNKLNSSMTAKSWFSDKRLSGGGAVMDHTVHLADMMRWYTGSEAKEVYCEIGRKITPRLRVEDTFLTTVTFENGVLGHIDGSWSYPAGYQAWGDVTLEVLGSKGMLFVDAFRQNIYFTGTRTPNDKLSWHGYGCDPNTEMIRSFADSILQDREPFASVDDGIKGLQITLASYESSQKGESVRPASR